MSEVLLGGQILLGALGFAAGGYLLYQVVESIAKSGNSRATTIGLILAGGAMISGLLLSSLSAVLLVTG